MDEVGPGREGHAEEQALAPLLPLETPRARLEREVSERGHLESEVTGSVPASIMPATGAVLPRAPGSALGVGPSRWLRGTLTGFCERMLRSSSRFYEELKLICKLLINSILTLNERSFTTCKMTSFATYSYIIGLFCLLATSVLPREHSRQEQSGLGLEAQ